jgi:hypothetical protein
MSLPDFVIIGAMKCATTSLHDQLARIPGIFMTTPKEPNFFSDDAEYARGMNHYERLFRDAAQGDLKGESSTHYTKLPVFPNTVPRLIKHAPAARFIYIVRHPIARLVSHFIHEWTQRAIMTDIHRAIDLHPELIAYGCYSRQLRPYLEAFGPDRVLLVFFESLVARPDIELRRVLQFIGYPRQVKWDPMVAASNASSERMRASWLRDRIVYAPGLSQLRARLPRAWRERVKRLWTMRQRPALGASEVARLSLEFDRDLAALGNWIGRSLSVATFKSVAMAGPPKWRVDAVRADISSGLGARRSADGVDGGAT